MEPSRHEIVHPVARGAAPLACEYVEARGENPIKPTLWNPEPFIQQASADAVDMRYLQHAHFPPDGRTVEFPDGSMAYRVGDGWKQPWVELWQDESAK